MAIETADFEKRRREYSIDVQTFPLGREDEEKTSYISACCI